MKAVRELSLATLTLALTAAPILGQQAEEWSFSNVERIELRGLSGDLIVRPGEGSGLKLILRQDVRPRGAFRGEVERDGTTLRIREHWGGGGSSSGPVDWILEVPPSLEPTIVVRTSSGDLEVSGVVAGFRFETSSGDVELRGVTVRAGSSFDTSSGDYLLEDAVLESDVRLDTSSGDIQLSRVTAGRGFEASTSSGDVTVEDSHGVLEGHSSSGDVRVYPSELTGASHFSSSSGDVVIRLTALPAYDLEASSASGDVRLDVDEFGSDFTLLVSKREDRGHLDVPFPYTAERTYLRNGRLYVEKTVQRGAGRPEIRLRTATGSVVVGP